MLKPFGQHLHDRGEILARQVAVRPGAAEQREQRVLAPFLRRDLGDDLLRQHVERPLRDGEPVEFAARDAVEQRGAFDEFVARQREQPALRRAADRVARAPDALQERRDRARRAELADQIDLADIDAEFERGGRDQRLQRAALEPLLGVEPALLRQAAVMRRDLVVAEPLRQCARGALGHAAGVDEDQRRAVRLDQLGDAVVDLLPDLARHHRFERRGRQFEREIARPTMAGVDDRAFRRRPALRRRRRPESGRPLDRLLRRRQADALQPPAAQRIEPLERQREMRAALVRRDRVDLVDDDGARVRQHRGGRIRSRAGCRAIPASSRGCAAARGASRSRSAGGVSPVRTQLRISTSGRPRARNSSRMPASGASRFLLDVVRQRLQRRDIDDLRLVRQRAGLDALRAPARRSRRETRPASCPSRSAPRSARAVRP